MLQIIFIVVMVTAGSWLPPSKTCSDVKEKRWVLSMEMRGSSTAGVSVVGTTRAGGKELLTEKLIFSDY